MRRLRVLVATGAATDASAALSMLADLDTAMRMGFTVADSERRPFASRIGAVRRVLRRAEPERADLVVVGGSFRMGHAGAPIVERLIARASCPVLFASTRRTFDRRRIAVPAPHGTNGVAALAVAAGLSVAAGASLRIVEAIELPASVAVARARDPDVGRVLADVGLERLGAAHRGLSPRVRVHTALRIGTSSQLVRQMDQELDMVVVECRLLRGISARSMRRLVRRTTAHVVLVPASADVAARWAGVAA